MEQPQIMPALEIKLFGTMEARVGGEELPPLRSKRGLWILALLILHEGREMDRGWLAGTLWAESSEAQALANLRRTLTDLREALGEEASRLYAPTPHTLRLNLENAWVDLVEFDKAVKSHESAALQEAVRLHRAPLLESWTEDWVLESRLQRTEAYLNTLETLADHALKEDKPESAIPYLRLVLNADPFRDTACRALIQALHRSSNFSSATETYRAFRLLLREELNCDPDPETTALYRQLKAETRKRASEHTATPSVEKPSPSLRKRGLLPRPLTHFLGREADVALLTEQVEQERLVTLTGVGGIGKTRLAIQVAAEVEEEFAGGVWFIDLAALTDPAHLPHAIASVMGVREQAERSVQECLLDALAPQELLLVLDNCEHLLESCASQADILLSHAPLLHILTTSRQPLGITGENIWRVAPLSLPEPEESLSTPWEHYDAPRLFLERAKASGFTLPPTASQVRAILEICRHLDGLPLAIELAAARVTLLSVEQIAQRLDDRFRLLIGGSRTALPRHKTLRALFDWSYDLLAEAERILFRRLAIFQGSWSLEAVEGICAEQEQETPCSSEIRLSGVKQAEAMNVLASLVEKSLVISESHLDLSRYRLLESVREYALEHLEASGETTPLRERHSAYYLQQAQRDSEALNGAQSSEALHAFENDLGNLRKGMDWAVEQGSSAEVIAYGKALFGFLRTRGLYSECLARLALAEDAARQSGDGASLARLLNQQGLVAWERFDLGTAYALFSESYAISEEIGDKPRMLSALVNLGNIAWGRSDFQGAQRVYTEALALAQETQQERHEATLLLNLGILAIERGDYAEALHSLETGLIIHRRLQSDEYIAHTYYNLAELYRRQGHYDTALEYTHQCCDLYEARGNLRGLALAEVRIGINCLESGNGSEAWLPVEKGLQIAREIGDKAGEMYALEVQGRLQGMEGNLVAAETLFRQSLNIACQVGDRKHIAQTLTHYGAILLKVGQLANAYRLFRIAWQEGQTLGLKDEMLEIQRDIACLQLSPEEKSALDGEAFSLERLLMPPKVLTS